MPRERYHLRPACRPVARGVKNHSGNILRPDPETLPSALLYIEKRVSLLSDRECRIAYLGATLKNAPQTSHNSHACSATHFCTDTLYTLRERGTLPHSHTDRWHTATHGRWRSYVHSLAQACAVALARRLHPLPLAREWFTRDGIIAESCGPTTPQQPWLRRRHRARQERAARVAVGKGAWTRVLAPTIGEDPGSTRLSRLPAASHCYLE